MRDEQTIDLGAELDGGNGHDRYGVLAHLDQLASLELHGVGWSDDHSLNVLARRYEPVAWGMGGTESGAA